MDYFGWTLSQNLLMQDSRHLQAHNLIHLDRDDFEPDYEFWMALLEKTRSIAGHARFSHQVGSCFHLTNGAGKLILNMGLLDGYLRAIQDFGSKQEFELGLHSIHRKIDIVCSKGFEKALEEDLKIGERLGITALVEHAPLGTVDKTEEAVEILCSPKICEWLMKAPFPLCWENKASYRWKPRYYGSIKAMVGFLETLQDGLIDAGYPELVNKHLATFDTGHLLISRNYDSSPHMMARFDEEIADYLPQFARRIKVFHIQVNDGLKDHHVTPFSNQFLTHKSRVGLDPEIMRNNSELIIGWMKICQQYAEVGGRHLHLEAATLPYHISQYLEFAQILSSRVLRD